MGKLDNYKFGVPYREKIEKEDADEFSIIFGEGSASLTELIKYCILNGISTLASCKGHPEDRGIVERLLETGYISFIIEDDMEFAYFLASMSHRVKGVKANLEYLPIPGKVIILDVPATKKGMSEDYFGELLEQLKEYSLAKERGESIPIDPSVKPIVDYVFSAPKLGYFVVDDKGYKKRERVSGIYLAPVSKCSRTKANKAMNAIINGKLSRGDIMDNFLQSSKKKR